MNSWGNDKLERRIDELLASSVSRGSEPEGFSVHLIPSRPPFPWMKVAYILIAAAIAGFFMNQWLSLQNLDDIDYGSVFSLETLSGLFSGISTGKAVSLIAVAIGLGGTLISFLSERQRVLHRML